MNDQEGDHDASHNTGDSVAYQKFGEAAIGGFQVVPDILLKRQGELGLTNVELVVLLNILMHWWTPGKNPYPRPSTIAHRMNSSTRTIQRAIAALEEKRLLLRENDLHRTYLNPQPLVVKLAELVRSDEHYQYRKSLHMKHKDQTQADNPTE